MHRNAIVLLAGCVLALFCARLAAEEVIVYGTSTPEWNKKLGTTANRGGCARTPEECLKNVEANLSSQHTSRFYLNLVGDLPKVAREATEYSQLSLSHPGLYEIGIDDFYSHWVNWCREGGPKHCTQELAAVLRGIKGTNPKLHFGVTIYEDEVPKLVADRAIPPDYRKDFDSIHLFLHFRQNGKNFPSYVAQLKGAFPNARIILGLYPYDRVEGFGCKEGSSAHCSAAEENTYFESALKKAHQMAKDGEVFGIEFYPGNFGSVETWNGWDNPKICSSGRRSECIRNTKAMHETIAATLAR